MDKKDFKEISLRVKKRIEFLGYTQEALAEKLDISYSHYSKFENGFVFISLEVLINLSKILNLSLDEIVFGESKLNSNNKEDYILSKLREYDNKTFEDIKNLMDLIINLKK